MEFLLCNEYACLLFEKGDNFCDILFAFLHTKSQNAMFPKWKGLLPSGFAPTGSKFFPYRVGIDLVRKAWHQLIW